MLIVEEKNNKLYGGNYVADIPLIISDLYYQDGGVIETGLNILGPVRDNSNLGFHWPFDGNSLLINGTSGDKNISIRNDHL